MLDSLSALNDCIRDRVPAVWVTVARVRGSTPREAGTKMLVTQDTLYGTIGGGNLEFEAISIARELLTVSLPQNNPGLHRFPLGPSLGQCCG
ncbi:MAG: xanthine dehydrogenase accessory protein XdhC, partial [Candidatus Competibacteraceae bacterium]|nr:xanthine dehydrogenase accessory protein XdhC [Candidatus Competibacteraceae bacterium]